MIDNELRDEPEDLIPDLDLPEGWASIPLSELATNRSGNGKLIKGKLSDKPTPETPYPGFSASGQDVWLDSYEQEGTAIIISAVGARCGKAFEANGKWSAIANTHIVRPNEAVLDSKLFWYLINDEKFWVRGGSAQPFVKVNKTFERLVALPPLAEQKRIADKLEAVLGRVDACRARLDGVPDLLKRFRQSVLAAATSGQLTEDWRSALKADDEQSDEMEFKQLNEKYFAPERWTTTTFFQLTNVITSGSRGWADYYSSSGAVFIRAQNINSDRLVLDDVAYVSLPEKAEGKRALVQRDDLLITITGANVGKSARVMIDLEEAYISQHVALLKLRDRRLAAFLELFLWAENAGRWQLNEAAYGGGKPGLNLQNLRDLVVALPPLPEQAEIVRRVEALFAMADRIEARLTAARAQVERLTPATLSKAFRGDLVPQDPNDEPASQLLDQIRTAPRTKVSRKR